MASPNLRHGNANAGTIAAHQCWASFASTIQHALITVSVNNSKPLWFLLDTGASNLINLRHAQALGLKLLLQKYGPISMILFLP
jgi:predicted aspartyl protease